MGNSSTLWLIPARGGSKGIPNKNIKTFVGTPLVNISVIQALECAGSNDTVFVSTDSESIREIVEKTGLTIPFLRPSEFATDTSSTHSVIVHTLQEFKKMGKEFDNIVLLQPTSPLRTIDDINGAKNLWTPEIDMVVSVTEAKANPYYNAFETNEQGFLNLSKGEGIYTRRQDAPKVWEYNGAIYIITVESVVKNQMTAFKKIVPYEMPRIRSIDLDEPEDWILAEILFKRLQNNKG